MYVFIAIIFLFELELAIRLILAINSLCKRIRVLNAKVTANREQLCKVFIKLSDVFGLVKGGVNKTIKFVERKRQEVWNKIIGIVAIYLILAIFKVRFKKAATIVQYAFLFRDFYRGFFA